RAARAGPPAAGRRAARVEAGGRRDGPRAGVVAVRFFARTASLWRGLVGRSRVRAELDEELASCLEELVARKQAAGVSEPEAREAARREMGSLPHLRMGGRESWLVGA